MTNNVRMSPVSNAQSALTIIENWMQGLEYCSPEFSAGRRFAERIHQCSIPIRRVSGPDRVNSTDAAVFSTVERTLK